MKVMTSFAKSHMMSKLGRLLIPDLLLQCQMVVRIYGVESLSEVDNCILCFFFWSTEDPSERETAANYIHAETLSIHGIVAMHPKYPRQIVRPLYR